MGGSKAVQNIRDCNFDANFDGSSIGGVRRSMEMSSG
jgi:hypothetical protein